MSEVLTGADDERLALATQENLYALFRAMAALPGGELDERGGFALHRVPLANPMFNGVWATRLSDTDVDGAIDDVLSWFAERDAPFFFWWTGPGTRPADLGERLAACGLRSMVEQAGVLLPGILAADRGSPCMVADLAAMDEGVLDMAPRGLSIEPVRSEQDVAAFVDILAEAMAVPHPMADAWGQAARAVGPEALPWRMVLARLDGEPVATNMLFTGAGVASVYGVATRPASRGKGIGAAVTLAPLLEARDEGYEHAVLFSSQMGVRAYERIGFRLTSHWIDRYLWMRPDRGVTP
jgi:GNAT superfamily N-acetyltransferase